MEDHVEGGWIKHVYYGIVQAENFIGNFFLLIIRLFWGGSFVMTGVGKLMNIGAVGDYFASLHVPAPYFTAYVVGIFELLGGISLFIGLFSRLFSIALVVILIVAYATAHPDALASIFVKPSMFFSETPFLFLYASLVVLCFGPGFVSFDYWMERRAFGRAL